MGRPQDLFDGEVKLAVSRGQSRREPVMVSPVGVPAPATPPRTSLVFIAVVIDYLHVKFGRPVDTRMIGVIVGVRAGAPTSKPEIGDEPAFEKLQGDQGELCLAVVAELDLLGHGNHPLQGLLIDIRPGWPADSGCAR